MEQMFDDPDTHGVPGVPGVYTRKEKQSSRHLICHKIQGHF